jgi:hypothetical protein
MKALGARSRIPPLSHVTLTCFFFSQCFVESFFFFFFSYLLKSFSLKLITAPFFSVMPAYVVECTYAGRDGVDVIVVMEPFFFLSFFPTHTMIEDVASLKLRAEMRRKSTTFFFFYFILFFSLSLSNDTKAKYHLVASMPHPLDDRMLCPWTCFTFDVVQQAEQNSLSGETGFHCRNS